MEIVSFIMHNDDVERIKKFNDEREPTKSLFRSFMSKFSDGSFSDAGVLIDNYRKDREVNDLLEAKRLLHERIRHLTMTAKVVCARLPTKKLMTSDSPMDISCQGFLDKSRQRLRELTITLKEVERMLSYHGIKLGIDRATMLDSQLRKVSAQFMMNPNSLYSFVRYIRSSNAAAKWRDVCARAQSQFMLEYDAKEHWDHCYKAEEHSRMDYVALSSECKSAATSFLPHMKPIPWSENYRQLSIQCSDRHLEDCSMYKPEPGMDRRELDQLLMMDGASLELFAPSSTAHKFHKLSECTVLLDNVAVESAQRGWPLYLFPRRCYERLTRALFDSGLLICDDYEAAETQMDECDMIQLPIIPENSHRSNLERLLRAESALMEYGSLDWMEWMARRLRYYDYNLEVIRFYHRTIAERDYCVQDERLTKRLREAFKKCATATTNRDKMALDAFIYSTMDTLEKFRRLVVIEAPHSSNEAHYELANFIRSIRMPPTVAINSPQNGSQILN
ncbi:hypothetical protein PMAYCL1PPCAC_03174 [Pristionchus mayeri]|uniref:Uncharacterized protein n=1 Tax=Pristionchus mayeri TaxID=1317129 RepID=A0AAN4Z449_9BILA|nr:hypothetical protein PMAYCL1PPCAC_03174 [Pristionchus mayeri]